MKKMKKNVRRNVLMVAAAMLMILCLSACSPDAEMPGFDVSVRSADSSGTGSGTDNNAAGNSSNTASQSTSGNSMAGEAMKTALTPSEAHTVRALVENFEGEGELCFTSDMSLSELKSFYETAVKNLGIKEWAVGQEGDNWGYQGTYGNGKAVVILIQDIHTLINKSIPEEAAASHDEWEYYSSLNGKYEIVIEWGDREDIL